MTRSTTDITYGVTSQTLEYRVPQGRPTSATFAVFADYAGDDDTAEFTGTATVESVNTTVDAASGRAQTDPQKINLTATTGITTSRKYLISEGSKQEWVQPIEIVSADYIRVRHPLQNDYTTAATFVGTTITATVDSTWVAAEENLSDHMDPNPDYRVRWAIVVGGVTHVAYSFFDLVRAPIRHQVDVDDLNARAPGLFDGMPTEYQVEQGRPLLDAAYKSVSAKLAAHGVDTDAFRNDEILDELVILRSLNMMAMSGRRPLGVDLGSYIEATRNDYETFFQQHVSVTQKSRLATGTTGGAEPVRAQEFWSK